MKKTVLKH